MIGELPGLPAAEPESIIRAMSFEPPEQLNIADWFLDARVREEADSGTPTVAAAPGSPHAAPYFLMARRTGAALARRAKDRSTLFPKIVVEES